MYTHTHTVCVYIYMYFHHYFYFYVRQNYIHLGEMKKNLKSNSETWNHASKLCEGVGEPTCIERFVKVKKKEKLFLLYCVYIYIFKTMMLKVILVDQNNVILAALEAS